VLSLCLFEQRQLTGANPMAEHPRPDFPSGRGAPGLDIASLPQHPWQPGERLEVGPEKDVHESAPRALCDEEAARATSSESAICLPRVAVRGED
jgi:hypothetical protein